MSILKSKKIAWILSLAMIISCIPVFSLAEGGEPAPAVTAEITQADKPIIGFVGHQFNKNQRFKDDISVRLVNGHFNVNKNENVTSWVTPEIEGVTYTANWSSSAPNPNKINLEISGTPKDVMNADLTVTIPQDKIQDGTKAVKATGTKELLIGKLEFADATIGGKAGYNSVNTDLTLKIKEYGSDGKIKFGNIKSNYYITDQISPKIPGLKYQVTKMNDAKNEISINVSGKPAVTNSNSLTIKLKSNDIKNSSASPQLTFDNVNFNIVEPLATDPKASMPAVTIDGEVGEKTDVELANKEITLTLTSGAFDPIDKNTDSDVSSWFSPTVEGLNYTLKETVQSGAKSAVIVVTGTATGKPSEENFSITIPAKFLQSYSDPLEVDLAEGKEAKYNIIKYTDVKEAFIVRDAMVANVNESKDFYFDITLKGKSGEETDMKALHKGLVENQNITDWFTPKIEGVTYKVSYLGNPDSISVQATVNSSKPVKNTVLGVTVPKEFVMYAKEDLKTGDGSNGSICINEKGTIEGEAINITAKQHTKLSPVKITIVLPESGPAFTNITKKGDNERIGQWFKTLNSNRHIRYSLEKNINRGDRKATIIMSGMFTQAVNAQPLTIEIDAKNFEDQVSIIKIDTKASVINVTPRADVPTTVNFNQTGEGKGELRVFPWPNTQYSLDGGNVWVDITSNDIINLTGVGPQGIKVKKKGTRPAEEDSEIVIPSIRADEVGTAQFLPNLPDQETGTLTVTSFEGLKYKHGNMTGWIPLTATSTVIRDIVLDDSPKWVLFLAKSGDGVVTQDAVREIVVSKEIILYEEEDAIYATKCTSKANDDGKISGLTPAFQYQKPNETTWNDVEGNELTNLKAGKYLIRKKATSLNKFPSSAMEVTVEAYHIKPDTSTGGGGGGGGGFTPSTPSVEKPKEETPVVDKAAEEAKAKAEANATAAAKAFTDVKKNDWFASSVGFVKSKGLMSGTGSESFSPKAKTSRAMLTTILYRLEGTPKVEGGTNFTDIAGGTYYADAAAWAMKNKVVSGYGDNSFKPENNISREQLATMLMNYAKLKGYYQKPNTDLNKFADANQVSSYAVDAIAWANSVGIINGKGGNMLDPKGEATRAEMAAMIARFCDKFVK